MNLTALKGLLSDERAVSPVIGVILMVAITVILAAVIGTFVLGLGDDISTTPQAQFGFDVTNADKNVTITHESGDSIAASDLKIVATGTNFDYQKADGTWAKTGATSSEFNLGTDGGYGTVSAGTSVAIGDTGAFTDQTIRVVYVDPDSDKTATLAKKTVN